MTLVEALVGFLLVGLVVGVAIDLLRSSDARRNQSRGVEAVSTTRRLVEALQADARAAREIRIGPDEPSLQFQVVSRADLDQAALRKVSGRTVVYLLDADEKAVRRLDGSAEKLFSYRESLGADKLRLDLRTSAASTVSVRLSAGSGPARPLLDLDLSYRQGGSR